MSIETINYLLARYYEMLTSTQYLLQDEIIHPSTYPEGTVEPKIKYRVEIEQLQRLIKKLEELKDALNEFGF